MILKFKQYSPLLMAIILLWLSLILTINASLSKTDGTLVYALDDAYIHTAMAKNFSQHGVWGVTRYEFTSSSSSLLWTLLLSGLYYVFGVNQTVPLLLNFFSATLLVMLIHYILSKMNPSFWRLTGMLATFIFFSPLPYLVLGGLEHVMQILIHLGYIYAAARVIQGLEKKGNGEKKDIASNGAKGLYFLAFLATMVRYEGLFIVLAISILFTARRHFRKAFLNIFFSMVPVVVYGVISMVKGWSFLPNSVLLKGNVPDIFSLHGLVAFLYSGVRQLLYNTHLLVLLVCVLLLLGAIYKKYRSLWSAPNVLAMVFLLVLAQHVFFAKSGYFLERYPLIRYDAYLAAMGMLAVFTALGYVDDQWKRKKVVEKVVFGLLIMVLILPLAERGITANLKVVRATANIYGQQYQMGLFLNRYYNGRKVAVNDIGAVCFLSDVRCFDVWGLATRETGALIRGKTFSGENVHRLAREAGVSIAVVYDEFIRMMEFNDDRPAQWSRVGQWRIPFNVVCARGAVSFFAMEPPGEFELKRNLRNFVPNLPREVLEQKVYIKD